MVIDLSEKFIDYAPRFIIGGNILIRGAWKFDLANNSVEPYDIKRKPTGNVIHWKYYPKKKAVNTIRLKGVIGKENVSFLFDTGQDTVSCPKTLMPDRRKLSEKRVRIGHSAYKWWKPNWPEMFTSKSAIVNLLMISLMVSITTGCWMPIHSEGTQLYWIIITKL